MRLPGWYLNSGTEAKKLRDLCRRASSEQEQRTAPSSGKQPVHLTEAQAAEVLRRYIAGDRPVGIAVDFGVTEWTVQNVRKRAVVPARPHGMTEADGFQRGHITKELRLRGFIQ